MTHFPLHVFTPTAPAGTDELNEIMDRWDENREVDPYFTGNIPQSQAEEIRDEHYPGKTIIEALEDWMCDTVRWSEEKSGYEVRTTYNPESKWDWWQIGGRWNQDLLIDGGLRVNSASIHHLDFAAKIDALTQEAHIRYDKFEKATDGLDIPPTFGEYVEGVKDREAARREYAAHPWNVAARKISQYAFMWPHYEFHVGMGGRETYVAENASPDVPLAWVDLDGQWHEQGQIGWFGSVSAKTSFPEHVSAYRSYRDSLPGETSITLLDCHI